MCIAVFKSRSAHFSSSFPVQLKPQFRSKQQKVNQRDAIEPSDSFSYYFSSTNFLNYLPPPQKKHKSGQLIIQQPKQLFKGSSILCNELVKRLCPFDANNGNHATAESVPDYQQPLTIIPSSSSSSDDTSDGAQPNSSSTGRKINLSVFNCDLCNYMCDSRPSLSYHMNSHTGANKPHTCEVCSKVFLSPRNLSNHRKIHMPPEFKCDFCLKRCSLRKRAETRT